jgi:NAD(P)-dependent dehydrogenase (short-subunit alcohol dehydrogenase family)/acyl dehydratase
MELFARASGDVNPLHVSAEYARRTPFGEPVVYGVLAALAACAQLRERGGSAVESVALEFLGPLVVGLAYAIEIEDAEATARVHVSDLGQAALEATIAFAEGRPRPKLPEGRAEGRATPAALDLASLDEGLTASGLWAPSLAETRELLERWGLLAKGFDELAVAALGWVSYLVGMELPGERATFWKLDLRLGPAPELPSLPLTYTAQILRRDDRVGLVEVDATLGDGLATANISAFVRDKSPTADLETLAGLVADMPELTGKVALVVGGSRGLGAAIGQALALRGTHVVLVYRDSAAEAGRVRDSLVGGLGSIEPIQGDAGNSEWCRATLRPLLEKRGGLDLLVCNASPPIRPLRFDPGTLERFTGFVQESVGLVAAPLAAFLTDLDARSGSALVISSAALTTLPPEWPHYVTAKAAVEGLASWAAAAHPRVRLIVVRPPKLLTDQMNSLLGRVGAARVEPVAAAIVRHLARPRASAPLPELVELEP